jgi:hypothetical protein
VGLEGKKSSSADMSWGSVGNPGGGVTGGAFLGFLVERWFWGVWSRWPLIIAIDRGFTEEHHWCKSGEVGDEAFAKGKMQGGQGGGE